MSNSPLFDDFIGFEPIASYGVVFLDDELVSINKGEVVLIGSDSGIGKSTLANLIAKTNAEKGVKVALFSIENSKGDYKRKEIWKKYVSRQGDFDLTFRKFTYMVLNDADKIEPETYWRCKQEVEREMENIYLVEHTTDDFNLETLETGIKEATKEKGCKLVIFDHIDYLDEDEENEKSKSKNFYKITMKAIRSLGEVYDVPIVVFSQLRKNNDYRMKVPSIDEFYGSGDKVKIATTVIVLAPNYTRNETETDKYAKHTYICIRKDRFNARSVADCIYNLKWQNYESSYEKGFVDKWGYSVSFEKERK